MRSTIHKNNNAISNNANKHKTTKRQTFTYEQHQNYKNYRTNNNLLNIANATDKVNAIK